MPFFVDAKGNRISGQTVSSKAGESIEVRFFEGWVGAPIETVISPYIQIKLLRKDGLTRVYTVTGNTVAGPASFTASNPGADDWDTVNVIIHQPPMANPAGYFPADIVSYAVACCRKWKVPVSVSLAQWALESNWGNSTPSQSNNPFGIKAVGKQASSQATTKEIAVDGSEVTTVGNFRVFTSISQSFDEHGRLLAASGIYPEAMKHTDDPDAFADALNGIYGGKNNLAYSPALRAWMKAYNIYRFDVK